MKTYPSRDSCTALLRKLGVERQDYYRFLGGDAAAGFTVDDEAAKASLSSKRPTPEQAAAFPKVKVIDPSKAVTKKPKPKRSSDEDEDDEDTEGIVITKAAAKLGRIKGSKAGNAAAGKAPKPRTVGVVTRELIAAGKDNAQVWAIIQKQFSLDEGKKYYPGWYRMDMKRKGLLPK